MYFISFLTAYEVHPLPPLVSGLKCFFMNNIEGPFCQILASFIELLWEQMSRNEQTPVYSFVHRHRHTWK